MAANGAFEALRHNSYRDRREPRFDEHDNMDQQPQQQQHNEHRRHGEGGVPTRTTCTQPLPLVVPDQAPRQSPGPVKRFAAPFLAVLGHYAVGVCTFSVMAAANVPGGGDVSQLIWSAAENTGPIALAIALAAGCWWV
jgi:hypothetical protein